MDWRSSKDATLAAEAARALRKRGKRALLVGGCVRDWLLEREPKDLDLATDATPIEVAALFPDAIGVGAHFGVMLLRRGGQQIEIATFRSDHSYTDGRHPEQVTFETDPRQDALRRDFTINAMFLDPESGEVLDYVGGRADLAAGIVRAVGDPERRFAEDHLRMLRAVRFAARLGFAIEDATSAAIRRLAAAIHVISAERVRDEIVRILTEGVASRGLRLLDETGLLAEILPEVKAMQGVEQPPEFHPEGDVWTHTLLMFDLLEGSPTATLAMGVLLHDVGKPGTFRRAPDRIRFDGHVEKGLEIADAILKRLKFSGEEIAEITALIENHMRWSHIRQMKQSTLKRFMRLPHFGEHMALHRVDSLSSHGKLDHYEFVREKLAELPPEAIRPPRLLTGDDLQAMGFEPGPLFKEILTAVEDAQLEGEVTTRDEAEALVRGRWPKA
ncbi:MAG: CCA tRNA nucleotidyltransferase [Bryobacteraceae bacterium]